MKKLLTIIAVFIIALSLGIVIDVTNHADVVIYSCLEEFRMDELKRQLKDKFPDYKIDVQYLSTGKCASRLKAEGVKTCADIVSELEFAYCMMLQDNFAELDFIDTSQFLDNLVLSDKFIPGCFYSFGVIVNTERLKAKNLPCPESYVDLLKPEYRNEIIMPNPKASGTGYSFVKAILNLYGEEKGWAYFDKLNENMKMYTSSGSGPINNLVLGENAIGIGMISQAVNEINNGRPILIPKMAEGNGYNACGNAVIKGKEKKPKVVEVFKFLSEDFSRYDKQHFYPERIFKEDLEVFVPNYPVLEPMDMTGFDSLDEKERILDKWKY